jgi:hypothetical protein
MINHNQDLIPDLFCLLFEVIYKFMDGRSLVKTKLQEDRKFKDRLECIESNFLKGQT